jgi:hypothetical protein
VSQRANPENAYLTRFPLKSEPMIYEDAAPIFDERNVYVVITLEFRLEEVGRCIT